MKIMKLIIFFSVFVLFLLSNLNKIYVQASSSSSSESELFCNEIPPISKCEGGLYKTKNCNWWMFGVENLLCSSVSCVKGNSSCVNGHYQICHPTQDGLLLDFGPNTCAQTNCKPHQYYCDESVYKYCDNDSRSDLTIALKYSNNCGSESCLENNSRKCDSDGNLYYCIDNKWRKSISYKCQSNEPSSSSSSSSSISCSKKNQGDVNCDGMVNDFDYQDWKEDYKKTRETCSPGKKTDFNGDGCSTLIDFEIWRSGRKEPENPQVPVEPPGGV